MDLLTPALIGIGLSMDCFAVALAVGSTTKVRLLNAALIIALSFGFFQVGMTIIGWFAGTTVNGLIANYGHWIAFLLLAIIGVKMIAEGVNGKERQIEVIRVVPVIILSVATSIDALPIGVTFGVIQTAILIPALIIGLVAFILSFTGVMTGRRLERVLGTRAEIAGGIILILMGLNIFTGVLHG
jgi:putative Mn2+ efflux pump MntP